jgi:hypothetical protein
MKDLGKTRNPNPRNPNQIRMTDVTHSAAKHFPSLGHWDFIRISACDELSRVGIRISDFSARFIIGPRS